MRVLYLDLDTLRPDHLGCYGYHRNTSPNIDSIAAEGLRFDNYYCSDAPCLPSRTALMTGRFGIHTGVVNHGGVFADPRPEGQDRNFRQQLDRDALPSMFKNIGFKTASISPFAQRHSAWAFHAGFTETFDTGKGGGESAEDVTPTVLNWLENNASNDNWFLQVNYWDAHTGYRAPAEFGNPFEDEPIPDWYTEDLLRRHQKMVGAHKPYELSGFNDKHEEWHGDRHVASLNTMNDLKAHIDGYDCGIAYMDSHLKMIMDALKEKGVYEDVVIIISADHGENQGEMGIYGEHGTADHACCRIPMIVRWPGTIKDPAVDTGFHYNIDLVPTLADMLGQEKSPRWDGQSYADALREGKDCGREYLVLSQCAHVCQRGVRFGDWMYLRTYHDGFHLLPREVLFNLKDDPYEQENVAEKYPKICQEAAHIYLGWHDEMMASMIYASDPLQEVLKEGGPLHAKYFLAGYLEHLKATGREWAIEELVKKHPQEFPQPKKPAY